MWAIDPMSPMGVYPYDPDTGRMVDICEHDGIRLYAQRGRWVHSPSEIEELAALERGEGVAW